ncbi:MAG: 23S rRNA pseudouridine(955/2504/2580) synthase, partial [Gammaproteobacteria bacterium]
GHPIAGDEKYGDRDFDKKMKGEGLGRLFLHAAALDCPLPGGERLHVEAPLGKELEAVLARLGA